MAEQQARVQENYNVQVQAGPVLLDGNLTIPEGASGLVVFVHGSGSSRHSPRNQFVSNELLQAGLGTLLFDLLTPEEEEVDLRTRRLRYDISLLARRAIGATDWLNQNTQTKNLKIGYFGASTGAAAALIAAAERPECTGGVVVRGGRPDLAASALPRVTAPTLFIVGQHDYPLIELNEQAMEQLSQGIERQLVIVPGTSRLFEEPGALEYVAQQTRDWFIRNLPGQNHAEMLDVD